MFFGGFGLYMLFVLPALLLGLYAQMKVKGSFNKYSRVRTATGMTGAQIARRFLDHYGLRNVQIEQSRGMLSDHYDPRKKVLRLSPEVYQSNSVAAAGVAAHEVGHALQDAEGYAPLRFRSTMVPAVQIGSWVGPVMFMGGFLMQVDQLAIIGLVLFSLTAVFAFVTLPVEFNATQRAKAWLANSGVIYQQENKGVNAVLDAAALTYVAAAIQAVMTILYYAFILFGRRRN
jgi:Zn-dependent membrane protease YugP